MNGFVLKLCFCFKQKNISNMLFHILQRQICMSDYEWRVFFVVLLFNSAFIASLIYGNNKRVPLQICLYDLTRDKSELNHLLMFYFNNACQDADRVIFKLFKLPFKISANK